MPATVRVAPGRAISCIRDDVTFYTCLYGNLNNFTRCWKLLLRHNQWSLKRMLPGVHHILSYHVSCVVLCVPDVSSVTPFSRSIPSGRTTMSQVARKEKVALCTPEKNIRPGLVAAGEACFLRQHVSKQTDGYWSKLIGKLGCHHYKLLDFHMSLVQYLSIFGPWRKPMCSHISAGSMSMMYVFSQSTFWTLNGTPLPRWSDRCLILSRMPCRRSRFYLPMSFLFAI